MEIGNKLREAREARGLTLEEVEEETKIRRKYLQALEEEQFQILPGPIYAKAFLKNYARFLNIDVEETLEEYNRQFTGDPPPEEPVKPAEERIKRAKVDIPGKPRYWLYLAAAVVVAGLAFSVYYAAGGMGLNSPADKAKQEVKQEPAQTPPQAGEQAQTPAGQPGAGQTGVNMSLNVKNKDSWIRVIVDGTPAFQGILSAGQSKSFEAKDKISIRLGNAGAVEVQVNGQNLGALGGDGDVIDREFTSQTRG